MCYANPVEDNGYFYDNYSKENAGSFESELEFHTTTKEPVNTFRLTNNSVANGEVLVRDHFLGYDRVEGSWFEYYKHDFTPTDNVFSDYTWTELTLPYLDNEHLFSRYWDIMLSNGDTLATKGETLDISLSYFGSECRVFRYSDNSKVFSSWGRTYFDGLSWWYNVYYLDGTSETLNDISHSSNSFSLSIVDVKKSIKSIVVHCSGDLDVLYPHLQSYDYYDTDTYYIELLQGVYQGEFTAKVHDKDTGLLSGLLSWVKNIAETVKSIPDKISGIVSSIAELPQKLWSVISEGLKNLFIPSQESVLQIKDNFNSLLEERFGALYESFNFLVEFVQGLTQTDIKERITFPKVSVNLGGANFSFGGWAVPIVNKKFELLFTSLKIIINMVAVISLINALKKRIEGILGGEDIL